MSKEIVGEKKLAISGIETRMPLRVAGEPDHLETSPYRECLFIIIPVIDLGREVVEETACGSFEDSAESAGTPIGVHSLDVIAIPGWGIDPGTGSLFPFPEMESVIDVAMADQDGVDLAGVMPDLLQLP